MKNHEKHFPLEGVLSPVWASKLPGNVKSDLSSSGDVKVMLENIRRSLNNDITSLVSRLGGSPLIFDDNRFTITKNFLLLSFLIGEVNILFATVWRYSFNEDTWKIIAPSLSEAIQDVEKVREDGESLVQSGAELTSFYLKGLMKRYHQFLVWFDSSLEESISKVTELTPFETRLIDVLSCCPAVDFELTLTRPSSRSHYCALTATYRILNMKCVYNIPDLSKSLSNAAKHSKLIKFMRECVQCDNTVYLQNIINDLSISECQLTVLNDEEKLEKMRSLCVNYESTLNDLYQLPVHTSYTTTLGKTRYFHDVYMRQLNYAEHVAITVKITVPILSDKNLPLILCRPESNPSTEAEQSRKETVSCVAKLKEYSICYGGKLKPEIHMSLKYNDGLSHSVSEIELIGEYDKNNKFTVSLNDKSAKKDETPNEEQ